MRFIINGRVYERPASRRDRNILADMIKRELGLKS